MKITEWAEKTRAKRICPKCNSNEVITKGGMKRYKCQKCGYYFDNKEWSEIEDKEQFEITTSEPISDTNSDSMADWGADRADLGGVR